MLQDKRAPAARHPDACVERLHTASAALRLEAPAVTRGCLVGRERDDRAPRRASLVFEKLPRAIAVSWPSLTGCASACAELTLSGEGATASSLSLHQFQYWVRLKLLVTPESWLSAAGDELAAWSATARARALEWTLMT